LVVAVAVRVVVLFKAEEPAVPAVVVVVLQGEPALLAKAITAVMGLALEFLVRVAVAGLALLAALAMQLLLVMGERVFVQPSQALACFMLAAAAAELLTVLEVPGQ
jgi:hypothetical protein